MAPTVTGNNLNIDKKNPRKNNRVCEYMTYSGREALKRLRTNALIALEQTDKKSGYVVGITSAQPSEGKSTVTLNLAYSLAELGKSVVLLDADMRRPTVNQYLGAANSPGLSEILTGEKNVNECLLTYQSSADATHFTIIRSGEVPNNPSELLNTANFPKLLKVLSDNFDVVLLDLPPVNAVVDAVNASKFTDGIMVVVRENHCPNYVLSTCMEQLKYAQANILGFVLNGCVAGAGKRYQYKYNYSYGYYGKK